MAQAGNKFGAGQQDQGKGDGSGGMSRDPGTELPDSGILSNRDKSRHSEQRGLDSGHVRNQETEDLNARDPDDEPAAARPSGEDVEDEP